ncbi:MAG: type II secretion system protein M [Ectothiorhodospiraceae bacterium]|nr:type II secretion system protein M [Ectothiorhodospiraceae bacterium]
MEPLRQWWDGLAARERRTLSLGSIALGVILFYFLVHQPVHDRSSRLEQDLLAQQELATYLQQARDEMRRLGGTSPAPGNGDGGQALFALADQSARQAGLGPVLRRVEPSGQRAARVNFERIAFDDLVRWLAALSEQHGITATVVTLRTGEHEGRVDAQLVLEAPES